MKNLEENKEAMYCRLPLHMCSMYVCMYVYAYVSAPKRPLAMSCEAWKVHMYMRRGEAEAIRSARTASHSHSHSHKRPWLQTRWNLLCLGSAIEIVPEYLPTQLWNIEHTWIQKKYKYMYICISPLLCSCYFRIYEKEAHSSVYRQQVQPYATTPHHNIYGEAPHAVAEPVAIQTDQAETHTWAKWKGVSWIDMRGSPAVSIS